MNGNFCSPDFSGVLQKKRFVRTFVLSCIQKTHQSSICKDLCLGFLGIDSNETPSLFDSHAVSAGATETFLLECRSRGDLSFLARVTFVTLAPTKTEKLQALKVDQEGL